ncbi:hypothetical protein niasHT_023338 [Heterodera trifolii]|uniref:Uncharacterized protein n=1 Tax=Heterodera trifolii TaxID=157864 RepID=A0ABD2JDS5_9BILA
MAMDVEQKKPKPNAETTAKTDASNFFGPISAATMGISSDQFKPTDERKTTTTKTQQKNQQQKEGVASEFASAISGATMGMGNEQRQHQPPTQKEKGQYGPRNFGLSFLRAFRLQQHNMDISQKKPKKK